MDLDADNEALQVVADGGSIDYSIWPDLVLRLIQRLEQIAHNEFPIPNISERSPSHTSSPQRNISTQAKASPQPGSSSSQNTTSSSQSADKENAPPASMQPNIPADIEGPSVLPPPILLLLNSITETLTTYFSLYPPHTVQRLSELILSPKCHYRNLHSYLHAVDRVVHVTSGANIYPLPAAIQDARALPNGTGTHADPNSISWGNSTTTAPGLGSDESLGGALLTPIPWLRPLSQMSTSNGNGSKHAQELAGEVKTESTETIDGPNGAGSIETVSISVNGIPSATLSSAANKDSRGGLRSEGGVTQGELLRQEQRAGVVPAAQLANTRGSGDSEGIKSDEEDDEAPHARGPDEIGMADTGPQVAGSVGVAMHGIDVEAAVGRRVEDHDEEPAPTTPKREADEELESGSKRMRDGNSMEIETHNDVETMVLVDADGKEENGVKLGEVGEHTESDTVHTSTV